MSVWMAETLIATTMLMALVMLLRRPVARLLGARVAYWLWALPVARMLLPALPGSVASPSPLHVAIDQSGLPILLERDVAVEAAFPWLELAIGFWFAGLLLFLLVQAVGYARFVRLMLADATQIGEEGGIRLVTSRHASGPLAFGVLRRYIVLPADFELRYDCEEQELAIAHERAHHTHGDLAANMAALLVLAMHWCNPIAWIAYRAYRVDQETACDARVLAIHGQDQAHIYGRAILKAAGGRQFAAACHLTRITTLKGRLSMLSRHDIALKRINLGMATIAVVLATGLALTASGSRAVEQMAAITDKMETADFSRLTNFVAQPARATVPDVPEEPMVPAASTVAPAGAVEAVAATVPAEPIVPAADMIPPVPPVPSVPPANAWAPTYRGPTQAEIRRMIPRVDVRNGCDGNETVSRRESVDEEGRRMIRVRICEAAIERAAANAGKQADQAARVADREAARADRSARAEAARADWSVRDAAARADWSARAKAERADRSAHLAELKGLRAARAQIARNSGMPASDRAEALREIDRSIADLHVPE